MTRTTALLLLCLSLCACDQDEQTKTTSKKKGLPETKRELIAALPKDPLLAAAELEKRIKVRLKVSEGLVILSDTASGMHVLPVTTPWVINCGNFGVSITFGTGVSRDTGELSNALNISLSLVPLEASTCGVATLELAKRLQAMFQGTGSGETKLGTERTIRFPGPSKLQD